MSDLTHKMANTSAIKRALTVRRARSKAGGIQLLNSEPIAIIGAGCRFPGGADNPRAYWQLLRDGRDAITQVPADRWDLDQYYDADPDAPGKTYTRWGGFLKKVDEFDAQFFGISPREVESMDPQQRLLLEVTWEALENAGLVPQQLVGTQTGVFAGISTSDYGLLFRENGCTDLIYGATGNSSSIAIGRISYVLGLQGPNVSIDTACSSSLVAIHLACQSLRAEECRVALAGGVNLILTPALAIYFSKVRAMAPDGRCKTFDAAADGYVRSEGCGMVVLKRISDALADGDNILALIRGSAMNHDGRSSGLTVPNGPSQQAVLRAALANAGVEPGQVSYVEAHGSGTPLGDPIEMGALAEVYGEGRSPDQPLMVGAVKTNIGHTESAAGIAGVIKVVLALQNREIPAHLHFKNVNPHIAPGRIPAVIPKVTTPWISTERRIAGVSSFALSGTNAHVILEEAPPESGADPLVRAGRPALVQEDPAEADQGVGCGPGGPPHLLCVSARTPEALAALSHAYAEFLSGGSGTDSLADVCYTSSARRSQHECRLAVMGRSRAELAAKLKDSPIRGSAGAHKIVFIFPGQGSQWLGMGRELSASEPVFREALERCDAAFRKYVDWSLFEDLQDRTDVVQPMLFALQVALAALWASWGIKPQAVVGHSMGEVAAAYVAGALSLEDAARVICLRSKLLTRLAGQGAMAMVELSWEEARRLTGGLSVAASNSPRSTVLSGDPAAMDEVLANLERRGIFCRRVKVDVASHSPQVDPLGPELLQLLRSIQSQPATVPFYSTVSGTVHQGPLDATYWVRNLRQPVRFWPALQCLQADGHHVFLEISPHPILIPAVEEGLGREARVLPSMRREEGERAVMLGSLGSLYSLGHAVEWSQLYPSGRCVSLPNYPWQRQRFWLQIPDKKATPATAAAGHPLLGQYLQSSVQPGVHFWQASLSVATVPWLADHRVQDLIVLPAAAYIEMVLSAASEVFGAGAHAVEDIAFKRGLVIPNDGAQTVQLVLSAATFQVRGRQESGAAWDLYAEGKVRLGEGATVAEPVRIDEIRMRCQTTVTAPEFFQALEERGLHYGPSFQGLREISRREGEAVGRLRLPVGAADAYQVHPALLDAAFQVLGAALPQTGASLDNSLDHGGVYIPVSLRSLRVLNRPAAGAEFCCHAVLRRGDADSFEGDVQLLDEKGQVLIDALGLRLQRLDRARPAREEQLKDWLYEIRWDAQALTLPNGAPDATGGWMIFAGKTGIGEALAARLEGTVLVTPGNLPHPDDLRRCRNIVHLGGLDTPPPEATTLASLEAAQRAGCDTVVRIVQTLEQMGLRDLPRLWIVTRGIDTRGGLAQSPLWGLGRVIALERPELRCTRIELDSSGVEGLFQELCAGGPEDQIAWRDGVRYVARLGRLRLPTPAAPSDQPFRLEIPKPGILDNLEFRPLSRKSPGPSLNAGEVEIQVRAAGLNFNDVMRVMGIYPGLPDGPIPLGAECAGTVVAVGPGVEDLKAGDEVMAVAPFSFSSFVTTAAPFVALMPPRMSFEEAAAIPLVYMTAVYTLRHLAHLARGERILIHAASGGVGLAAIQIAQQAGAEIFATAGSPEKREFLKSLGVAHVMDSRSLAFAEQVMSLTEGRGVDVVLNSLSGDAMLKSLDVVAPFGRFLELGKRDIYENRPVGLAPFQKHLAYFSIDMARLFPERPAICAALFHEVTQGFEDGTFQPLPVRAFAIADAVNAFREMALARHIGKIVLSMQGEQPVVSAPVTDARMTFPPDRTYLITGGLSGLGLEVAQWMVDQGARHLALAGRSEPSSATRAKLEQIARLGARIETVRVDVAQPEHVARVLAQVDKSMPPLAGIIHAAGVLDDGSVLNMTPERFRTVMAPKMAGAWNLHTLTAGRALDFFVMFSSAASLLGSPGQSNYAAANAFLDALAHYRRGIGLPALSVNWGPWSQIGLAARMEQDRRLALLGILSLTPRQGVDALGSLMCSGVTQAAVIRLQATRWQQSYPKAAESPLLAQLIEEEAASITWSKQEVPPVRKALLAIESGSQRRALLESHLQEQLAQVLRMKETQIDRDAPLQSLGLDSLMGLELRNRLEASLGLTLSATLVWGHPTIAALAGHLAGKMEIALDAPAQSDAGADEAASRASVIEDLKQLSEEEAEALLLEELRDIAVKKSA